MEYSGLRKQLSEYLRLSFAEKISAYPLEEKKSLRKNIFFFLSHIRTP